MEPSIEVKDEEHEVASAPTEPKKKRPPMVRKGHPLYHIQVKDVALRTGKSKARTLTITNAKLILTPVNLLNPKSEFSVMAKHDYSVESEKFHCGDGFPLWDDTPSNQANPGDLFFFCHNQVAQGRDLAEAFYVRKKLPPSSRPAHWLIPQHQNRGVLVLSRYVGYCSVSDIMVATGSRPSLTEGVNCLRGTCRRTLKHDLKVVLESVMD